MLPKQLSETHYPEARGRPLVWSVCLESAPLAAIALRLQAWIAFTQQVYLLVFKVADLDVKASLSNKS